MKFVKLCIYALLFMLITDNELQYGLRWSAIEPISMCEESSNVLISKSVSAKILCISFRPLFDLPPMFLCTSSIISFSYTTGREYRRE